MRPWSVWVFLFLISPRPGLSVMEGFKDTLSAAKTYLDDVGGYVADGLKMIERAERFVDSTIGEECEFVCKKGLESRVRSGHVPQSNGCGSMQLIFDDSEGSYVFVEKPRTRCRRGRGRECIGCDRKIWKVPREFTSCCNEHDECYDTCGEDKDMCDVAFKKCLYAACKATKKSEFFDAKACRLKAKLAFLAVMGVGCQMFLDAQEEACECVKSSSTKTEL